MAEYELFGWEPAPNPDAACPAKDTWGSFALAGLGVLGIYGAFAYALSSSPSRGWSVSPDGVRYSW